MIRIALLFPLWLVLAAGETQLLHACPMHHVGAVHGASGGARSGSAHHVHDATAPEAPAPAPHSHTACACVGPCTLAGAVVVPSAPTAATATVRTIASRTPSATIATPRSRADRLLPYPNGPPSRLS